MGDDRDSSGCLRKMWYTVTIKNVNYAEVSENIFPLSRPTVLQIN